MNTTRKFKHFKCAPNKKKTITSTLKYKSCLSNAEIFNLKILYNKKFTNKITSNNTSKIWYALKKKLKTKCSNELCWHKILDKKINIKKSFRPFSPKIWKKKPYKWLSSTDLIDVMHQYEEKFNFFKFIGPSPIDFDDTKFFSQCVSEELCKINIRKLYKSGKTKIGIIFNTDPHYKGGQHWICLFIDLNLNYIFYFDSNGDPIPKRIKILKDRITNQALKMDKELLYYSNNKMEHQKKDGQCGIYVLYVIIELLREIKTPQYFKKFRVPDELMRDYRQIYYNVL